MIKLNHIYRRINNPLLNHVLMIFTKKEEDVYYRDIHAFKKDEVKIILNDDVFSNEIEVVGSNIIDVFLEYNITEIIKTVFNAKSIKIEDKNV